MPSFRDQCASVGYKTLTNSLKLVPPGEPSDGLDELVLHVSDDCNLRCIYCFADKGRYGNSGRLMTFETAARAIDAIINRFRTIGKIKFFGGEPLLNYNVMNYVCSLMNEHASASTLHPPVFNVVTNLTLINENILSFFVNNDFGVTVSLDGPEEIHDALRKFSSGTGSYWLVGRNLSMLRAALDSRKIAIETVYTPIHTVSDVSIVDVYQFISNRFGITNVIIHPIVENEWSVRVFDGVSNSCRERYYNTIHEKAVEYGRLLVEETSNGKMIGLVYAILNNALSKELVDAYCGLGVSTLSVMSDGSVYPCYMFANRAEFLMDRVSSSAPFSRQFDVAQARYVGCQKSMNPHCSGCEIRNTCTACQGSMFGKWRDPTKPVPLLCDYYTGLREGIFSGLHRVAADLHKWKSFVQTIQAMSLIRAEPRRIAS
jgi:uncharacterized protein